MSDFNSAPNNRSGSTNPPVQIGTIFLLSVVIMLLELILFGLGFSLISLFALHTLIVSFCLSIVWAFSYKQWDLRFPILLLILVASLGPFGALICAATLLLHKMYARTSQTLMDLLSALFPESHFDPTTFLYERIIYGLDDYGDDYNPMPFMDVISFGTEKQKRLAIEKILRYFRPVFAPALLKALQDPCNGIRVLAATAITTLDQLFFEEYLILEERYRAHPENRKTVLAFAEHCDQYASSQILDEDRLKKMVSQAIEGYEKCLKMDSDNATIRTILGRLYITDNQPEKARRLLENIVNKSGEMPGHINKWYMCALYDLKKYTALKEYIAKTMTDSKDTSLLHEEKELVFTWCPEVAGKIGGSE